MFVWPRRPPRDMCEYIVGRRLPRARIRPPTASSPNSLLPLPPAPESISPKPQQAPKAAACECCKPRPRSRSPRREVTIHVTDFDSTSDESSGDESSKETLIKLKSALKKPPKEVKESPNEKTPEIVKTTTHPSFECECAVCLKLVLNDVKDQNRKKHVTFEDRYFSSRTFG